jgi:hypothetical protein
MFRTRSARRPWPGSWASSRNHRSGIEQFGGIGRRFADIGTLNLNGKQVLAFEDYGHHPTELDAVIRAARDGWPDRRLVLVFQPHRYTRTRDQFDAFARVLGEADVLVLADIYPAGEKPLAGIDADALAEAVLQRSELPIHRVGTGGRSAGRAGRVLVRRRPGADHGRRRCRTPGRMLPGTSRRRWP